MSERHFHIHFPLGFYLLVIWAVIVLSGCAATEPSAVACAPVSYEIVGHDVAQACQ